MYEVENGNSVLSSMGKNKYVYILNIKIAKPTSKEILKVSRHAQALFLRSYRQYQIYCCYIKYLYFQVYFYDIWVKSHFPLIKGIKQIVSW